MYRQILRKLIKRQRKIYKDIDPEDIFIDSANLPGFNENRLEGRIEQPVPHLTFLTLKVLLGVVAIIFVYKLWMLGVIKGPAYAEISRDISLSQTLIFANRGVIYDRNGLELATNAIRENETDYSSRVYSSMEGMSHIVGYLRYPKSDSKGIYYEENYVGQDGVESFYNDILSGKNGLKLRETDVHNKIISESVIKKPVDGQAITLAIDAEVNQTLYRIIKNAADGRGFVGGAGVIMDVSTGEILAMTSYPEYNQNIMTDGKDKQKINQLLNDPLKPFINRVVGGSYTPGSIIKPIIALAALNEGLISPSKQILSTGSIVVPNPYDPSKPSIFKDWKAHGWTDMRRALAVSSDVYFYSIGGGFGGQAGLGIERIDRYFRLFGLAEKTEIDLFGETEGIIPTPEWKKEKFNGDIWRLGDTYITAIGQYGTLITPLQGARFMAAIANEGKMVTPSVLKGGVSVPRPLDSNVVFSSEDWKVIKEGLRDGVLYGTSVGLNIPGVKVAAKTGTAEVGTAKKYVHSWSTGFFPLDRPRYAFVVMMEKGPSVNTVGATSIMRQLFDWMSVNAPEYLREN